MDLLGIELANAETMLEVSIAISPESTPCSAFGTDYGIAAKRPISETLTNARAGILDGLRRRLRRESGGGR